MQIKLVKNIAKLIISSSKNANLYPKMSALLVGHMKKYDVE